METHAQTIGRTIREAREKAGYLRGELVGTQRLKGKLTGEGLRKIEHGERIPQFKNIRLLGSVLGLSKRKVKELEQLALETNVERVARRAGNASVTFEINGKPLEFSSLPTKKKTETFVRNVVEDLLYNTSRYGIMMKEDEADFRMRARSILYKHLEKA